MNIFILSTSPQVAATLHADIHINKMILESAQMLSTAAAVLCNDGKQIQGLYKPTHTNHPCNVWSRQSFSNVFWLHSLIFSLEQERKLRFGSVESHKSKAIAIEASRTLCDSATFPQPDLTPFAEAVPDHIKARAELSAVEKYRLAYRYKSALGLKMNWTGRDTPAFML